MLLFYNCKAFFIVSIFGKLKVRLNPLFMNYNVWIRMDATLYQGRLPIDRTPF